MTETYKRPSSLRRSEIFIATNALKSFAGVERAARSTPAKDRRSQPKSINIGLLTEPQTFGDRSSNGIYHQVNNETNPAHERRGRQSKDRQNLEAMVCCSR